MDRLDMMRCFVGVADHGSFAAAARKLGLSTSALTRHVAGLEETLRARLFQRTTRAVSLTDEGARLLDHARALLSGFEEARAALEGQGAAPSGHLVVSAPVIFGRMHVGPLLSDYALAHPGLRVELLLSDRFEKLVESRLDAAIRIGHLDDSSDIAVRVGSVRRVLVASPAYLNRAPPLNTPEDLEAHRLISFQTLTPTNRWGFATPSGYRTHHLVPHFMTDSADIAISHACRGGGLTLALSYQVADMVAQGQLVRVLADAEPPSLPVNFVMRDRRLMPAKTRALLEAIQHGARWDFP